MIDDFLKFIFICIALIALATAYTEEQPKPLTIQDCISVGAGDTTVNISCIQEVNRRNGY